MEKIKSLITSRFAWAGLLLIAVIVPVILFVDRQGAFEIQNAMIVSIAAGIAYGFFRAFLLILRRDEILPLSGWDALIVGVFTTWLGLTGLFVLLWWFRVADEFWVIDHWTGIVFRWLLIIGGSFHLAAAGAKDGYIPRASVMRTATVIALALTIALILISLGYS